MSEASPTFPAVGTEQRPLTVLFADLVGSTSLLEQIQAEDYADLLRVYRDACTMAIRRRGGVVGQYQGDGLVCYFGYPSAAEDDAARAIDAALEIVEQMGRIDWPVGGVDLQTRIGIATGPVLLDIERDDLGEKAVGPCLNLAARLEALAEPNTALVCHDTRRLVGDLFDFERLAPQEIRGFDKAREVFRPRRRRSGPAHRFQALRGRHAVDMVGREAELAGLLDRLVAAEGGEGGGVVVIGEAGIGKSKLVSELLGRAEKQNVRAIVLQCAPEQHGTALHPVRNYLQWVAGVTAADSTEGCHRKLERLFSTVWQVQDDRLRLLLDALSPGGGGLAGDMEDSAVRRRQLAVEALCDRVFEAGRGAAGTILVLEDAHWIDPSTLQFVRRLAERASGERALIVLTTRPEPPLGDGSQANLALIELDRLSPDDSRQLARSTARDAGLTEDLIDKATELGGGNPLFVEECAAMLAEENGGQDGTSVPPTLAALIQGRLDRLDRIARRLALAASAYGLDFNLDQAAIAADLETTDALQAAERLSAARLVSRGADDVGGMFFRFNHALIRDAIHGSLGRSQRRALHGRIADAMAATGAHGANGQMIAGHLALADRPREAAEAYLAAAVASAGAGNAAEALSMIECGLQENGRQPDGAGRDELELRLRAVQGPTQMVTQGPGAAAFGATQTRALSLLRKLDRPDTILPVIYNCALHDWARGDLAAADRRTQELAERNRGHPSESGDMAEHTMRGLVAWHRGETELAQTYLSATVALYDAARHRDLYGVYLKDFGVFSRFYLGLSQTVLGDLVGGARSAEAALQLAREVRHPHAVGFGLLANFNTALLRGDIDAADRFGAEGLSFSTEQGFPEFAAMARVCLGRVACRRGDAVRGLPLMEEGATQWNATGFKTWQAWFAAMIAEERIAAGDLAGAESVLDTHDRLMAESGERQFEVPLTLARTQLYRALGDSRSDTLLDAARQTASAQQAVLWSARVESAAL